MKPLMAVIFAALLVACAETQPPMTTGIPHRPYAAYATNRNDYSPANSPFKTWTTAQLQQRRRDLYGTVEYVQSRHGTPVYTVRGGLLPQQDEIYAIEAELNQRYKAGDRSAELIRPIPGETHI